MKKIILLTAMILAVTFYNRLFAQKPAIVATNEPGWHHVGHTTASFDMQKESISVLGADEFSAIKIKVSEAPLHIERLQVFYESGDMEDIDVREHFSNGGESRVINLKHPDRDIAKIAFTYKTEANSKGEKADIDVYGLKTNQPAGSDSYKDERNEVKEEAREAEQEIREESKEVKDDAREARDEVREEAREADRKMDDDVILEDDNDRDVGDAIEEGAKDAAAAISDKKIKNKVGPGGETAYVADDGRYYIINNLGEKQFIAKAQLKNKSDND